MLFVLLMLVSLAQLLGYVFVKLHQPKVVGEILAGVVLGPALLGRVPWILNATITQSTILSFVYWLGLLLLMFYQVQSTAFCDNCGYIQCIPYVAHFCDDAAAG